MERVTITLDIEDHRPGPEAELRFPDVTRHVSDWLTGRGWSATFFVVGEEAERHPDLVAEIARGGHEIALHGYAHRPLTDVGPGLLAEHLRRGRDVLEQAAQQTVVGFRAPQFSLTADAVWATDLLAEAGFTYSSSVLPSGNPLFGFPGAPRRPFLWPSGVVELPAPVLGRGRARVPLGGLYLRLLPTSATTRLLRGDGVGPVPWLYFHPYDFDPDEKFYVVRDANPLASPLQWVNRRRTRSRIEAIVGAEPGPALRDRLTETELEVWSP